MRLNALGYVVAVWAGYPREYPYGAVVEVKANALTSAVTQLSRDYYFLPFCRPATLRRSVQNLGENLQGNLISSTGYHVLMGVEKQCEVLPCFK